MKRNKKFLIRGNGFSATVETKFNSKKGHLFQGEAETRSDEIFKKVLKGISEINLDIAIEEVKRCQKK